MQFLRTKWFLIALVVFVAASVGALLFSRTHTEPAPVAPVETPQPHVVSAVISTSAEGRAITAYTYGIGTERLLFIGGIHGGYEWNTVLLAYQFMDYLAANPSVIPSTLSITVIPALNPDGVFKVVGVEGRFTVADVSSDAAINAAGRFNAHDVDLNRNFDCTWQATSTWQGRAVSAGTATFSEPEAAALRSFVLKNPPAVVVFWHSQANAVYTSDCGGGVLPATAAAATAYSSAANYPKAATFTAYDITGDSADWLSSVRIPAITVELQSHQTIEWDRNLAGITALFNLFSQ